MGKTVTICPENLTFIREQDPCMNSYNVEFSEVAGSDFWKALMQNDAWNWHLEPSLSK